METKNFLMGTAIFFAVMIAGLLYLGDVGSDNPADDVPDSHKLVVRDTEFVFSAPLEEVAKVPIHPDVQSAVDLSLDDPDYYSISISKSCNRDDTCGMLGTAVFDVSFRMSKVYQYMGYDNTHRVDRDNNNLTGQIIYLDGEPENYSNLTGPRVLLRKSPVNQTRVVMIDDVIIIEGTNETSIKKAADVYTLALLNNWEKYAIRGII